MLVKLDLKISNVILFYMTQPSLRIFTTEIFKATDRDSSKTE